MLGSFRDRSQPPKKQKHEEGWLGVSFKPENFIPGLIIGFICGLLLDLSKPGKGYNAKKISGPMLGQNQQSPRIGSSNTDEELKMVLVVRQDLKMGAGKIASQCAHAATGIYSELVQRYDHFLGETKCMFGIGHYTDLEHVRLSSRNKKVTFKVPFEAMGALWPGQNSCYMQESARNVRRNKLKDAAEDIGLPTFVVADAGRTQISAGSKTVLAIGPGNKSIVDSITGKLRLL